MFSRRALGKLRRATCRLLTERLRAARAAKNAFPDTGLSDDFYRDIPIFINNRDLIE